MKYEKEISFRLDVLVQEEMSISVGACIAKYRIRADGHQPPHSWQRSNGEIVVALHYCRFAKTCEMLLPLSYVG